MTAHTPGPWHVEPPDRKAIASRAIVSAADGYCSIYDAPLTRETEANARLIASAPDLLEALIKLTNESTGFLALADPSTHGYTNMAVLRERIQLARAAIAKAEGAAVTR